jgi:hypothetical protein
MGNPTANVLHGKVKRITHNPPYTLATVELDRNIPQEITISYLPVAHDGHTDGPRPDAPPDAASANTASAQTQSPPSPPPPSQGDPVTVLVPVPNAVIMKGI